MMENEILNSMQEQMKQLETEFNQVKESLQLLENNYKVSTENYNAGKEQHLTRMAQIQGAYTALHTQYEKYARKEEPKVEKVEPKAEPKVEPKVVEMPKVEQVKKETKPKTEPKPKTNKTLTPEEIAKLKQVTNSNKVDERGNEIPEYLQ